jgi:hypothetical protein
MLEQARIKRLQDAPIGPDPPPILQLERTASSGRRAIVVMRGGSYSFLSARFNSRFIPLLLRPRTMSLVRVATEHLQLSTDSGVKYEQVLVTTLTSLRNPDKLRGVVGLAIDSLCLGPKAHRALEPSPRRWVLTRGPVAVPNYPPD